jgi:hypothetical protein
MNIVKITGGMGNQMFQFAFARYLEEVTKAAVLLDCCSYETSLNNNRNPGNNHNGYILQKLFGINSPIAIVDDIKKYATLPDSLYHRMTRKYLRKKSHYIEYDFSYKENIFYMHHIIYYEGYWQSEKYFIKIADKIRDLFRFVQPLNNRSDEFLNTMPHPITSIHIRRGDYLKHKYYHVCTLKYYENAIKKIKNIVPNICFAVFSDDLDWCKYNLSFTQEESHFFIDWNKNDDSWQDMFLMSKCDHNIIANSTFSWWGAWLNNNQNKIVLAPEIWYIPKALNMIHYNYNFSDILPDNWISVPVN